MNDGSVKRDGPSSDRLQRPQERRETLFLIVR